MAFALALLLIPLALLGAFALRRRARRKARAALLATPLSEEARASLAAAFPLLAKLPPALHAPLEGRINLFLDQVEFIGAGGLDVTPEMRLSIAAQACLLIANTETWYDHLTTVLIYPGAFKSRQQSHDGYVVTEREIARSGESWSRGPVVLSWAHTEQGARDAEDGHNVVFHEFAHRIDDLSGNTNGVPLLNADQTFPEWEHAFLGAYKRHVHAVSHGRKTVLDPYGAENHAEFFAVAVESFFERPAALNRAEPEVYAQLSRLFRLDPASWA